MSEKKILATADSEKTEPMQVSFQQSPEQMQCAIFAKLPVDQQQSLAEAMLEEMRIMIRGAVWRFEGKTGLVVDSLSLGREVHYCGFPQAVIEASAVSVEEFKQTASYKEARERHLDRTCRARFPTIPFSRTSGGGPPFSDCGYGEVEKDA